MDHISSQSASQPHEKEDSNSANATRKPCLGCYPTAFMASILSFTCIRRLFNAVLLGCVVLIFTGILYLNTNHVRYSLTIHSRDVYFKLENIGQSDEHEVVLTDEEGNEIVENITILDDVIENLERHRDLYKQALDTSKHARTAKQKQTAKTSKTAIKKVLKKAKKKTSGKSKTKTKIKSKPSIELPELASTPNQQSCQQKWDRKSQLGYTIKTAYQAAYSNDVAERWTVPELLDEFWHTEHTNQVLNFTYKLEPMVGCHGVHSQVVLVIILSSPDHFRLRTRIRQLYGKGTKYSRLVFLIGKPRNQTVQRFLENESEAHRDVIQADFKDSYLNLTVKTLMGLHWVTTRCPGIKFIYKVDDDNKLLKLWSTIMKYVNHVPWNMQNNTILCNNVVPHGTPKRWSYWKWCVSPDEYPEETYPRYCAGGYGYLVPAQTAHALYTAATHTKLFWLEDVYITGILRQRLGVRLREGNTWWDNAGS